MGESLQIEGETAPLGPPVEPISQLTGISGRKTRIPDLPGKLDDGLGTESSVEVVMKKNLGKSADKLLCNAHRRDREVGHLPK
jgi:hypothetical protein